MESKSNLLPFHGTIAGSILVVALFFVAAIPLRADDCQKRIISADHKLHEAAQHHGWDSPEAQRYRQELMDARTFCWNHGHRWWNEDDHMWHTERDWDVHDHDHD